MKPQPLKNHNNDLWVLLNQTQHVLERARERELDQAGLSSMQAAVLSIIKSADEPVYPHMLARKLFRQPHTISGLITRMENQGLVERVKDMHRKNMVRIVLTKKGDEAYTKQQEIGAEAVESSLSCLSDKEKDMLRGLLQRVREAGLEELRQRQRLTFE